MDEPEIQAPRLDPKMIEVIIFAALALAILVSYRQYLRRSLAVQEAVALGQMQEFERVTKIPVTGMNGKVEVVKEEDTPVPGIPVIRDAETGATVESTEGPRVRENTGE